MSTTATIVYLSTSLLVALGAFGHDSNVHKLVEEFAKAPALDPNALLVVYAVWHFCSGCMLVFGALCIGSWPRLRAGGRDALLVPMTIGVFYVIAGLATVLYTGKAFFWVFTALGILLISAAWGVVSPARRRLDHGRP